MAASWIGDSLACSLLIFSEFISKIVTSLLTERTKALDKPTYPAPITPIFIREYLILFYLILLKKIESISPIKKPNIVIAIQIDALDGLAFLIGKWGASMISI